MALRVDDSERALERARALLCPEWQEQVGEGERRIPPLRAPVGTLIYLMQPDPSRRSNYLTCYDRDDASEFPHVYTAAFDDRFFFEVVQHCGGYQQYGAANAAARMAAQTQRHSVSRLNGLLA